jgi:hypothetical protein
MEHALHTDRGALIVNRNIPPAREGNILDQRVYVRVVNFHVIAVAAARPVPNACGEE